MSAAGGAGLSPLSLVDEDRAENRCAFKGNRLAADRATRKNSNPILNLMLALINWVEGRFDFTYVQSISDTCQKRLFPVNSRPLYH